MKNLDESDTNIKKKSKRQKNRTFRNLSEINGRDAMMYAPELVDEAAETLRKMKKALDEEEYKVKDGLDENEYQKLFENSKELSQIGDQIKRKIQENVNQEKSSRRLGAGLIILIFIIFIVAFTVGSMVFG